MSVIKKDNLIIDYRLGFEFINDAFHVFLKISEEDAIERLKKADRLNETSDTVSERNNAFKKQFENAYGIDYTLDSHYDLIINIDNKMATQEIINIILTNLKIKKMSKKITPQQNQANMQNANKGTKGVNKEYAQNQGDKGKQKNPNHKK